MTERIAQHAHCQICGKAVPIKETLCSDECKKQYQAMMKKRKMYIYIMYALIFVIIGLFVLQSFGTGTG